MVYVVVRDQDPSDVRRRPIEIFQCPKDAVSAEPTASIDQRDLFFNQGENPRSDCGQAIDTGDDLLRRRSAYYQVFTGTKSREDTLLGKQLFTIGAGKMTAQNLGPTVVRRNCDRTGRSRS